MKLITPFSNCSIYRFRSSHTGAGERLVAQCLPQSPLLLLLLVLLLVVVLLVLLRLLICEQTR